MSKSPDQIEKEIKEERRQADANLDELEERLSPGQMIDDFLRSAGDGPKKFATELAAQVRDNPVPFAVTAAGMAWLAAATQSSKSHQRAADVPVTTWTPQDHATINRYNRMRALELENRRFASETDDEFTRRQYHARAGILEVKHDDGEDFEKFRKRVDDAAHKTKDAAGGLLARIEAAGAHAAGAMSAAGQRVAGAASSAGHGVAGAASSAGQGIAGAARGAAGSASHAASSAGHGLASGASALGSSASDAMYQARRFERENPLLAGALAFAGGALIGSLVPNTRVENEAVGDRADQLRSEATERASSAAHEAVDEARETVRQADSSNGSPAHH